jgi:hypothetical protein
MTATEIKNWGAVLVAEPYVCAIMNWKYESNYFSRTDVRAALATLAQLAASHPSTPCRVP